MATCPTCHLELTAADAPCLRCSVAPPSPGNAPGPPANWAQVPAYSSAGTVPTTAAFSNVQPVWQFVLLVICSFGLYYLIWFYNNWQLIKERNRWNITPAARALFAVFWIRSQFHELLQIVKSTGYERSWSPEGIGAAFIIGGFIIQASERSPGPLPTLIVLAVLGVEVWVTLPVVRGLNAFWRHQQPGWPERRGLSLGGWAVAILGALNWLAILGSVLFPPP